MTPTAVTSSQPWTSIRFALTAPTPEYVGGERSAKQRLLRCTGAALALQHKSLECLRLQDGAGDVQCPYLRLSALRKAANIKQQFKLSGFGHEPAYHDAMAQRAVLYAITKLASKAKRPA